MLPVLTYILLSFFIIFCGFASSIASLVRVCSAPFRPLNSLSLPPSFSPSLPPLSPFRLHHMILSMCPYSVVSPSSLSYPRLPSLPPLSLSLCSLHPLNSPSLPPFSHFGISPASLTSPSPCLSLYRLLAADRYMFQNTDTTFANNTRNLRGTTEKLMRLASGHSL